MKEPKPDRGGTGKRDPIGLEAAAGYVLEECRMVLPGIQALFGFQLISVFSGEFHERLTESDRMLHLAAIVLVSIAVALLMTPAAIHRQSQQRSVSERFVRLSSRLLLAGMVPLAVALAIDLYLIGHVISGSVVVGAVIAAALLALIALLWIVLPVRERRRHA